MIAVWIFIGCVVGALVLFIIMNSRQNKLLNEKKLLENEKQQLEIQKNQLESQTGILESQKSSLVLENEKLTKANQESAEEEKNLIQENSRLKAQVELHEKVQEELKSDFQKERDRFEIRRKESEENAEKLRKESDEQWQLKFDKLKEEFQNIAGNLLSSKQEALQQNNKEQIGELLKPLQQQFDAFKKSVEESKTSSEVSKRELKDSFEATLKLFAQQQNQAVEALKEETLKIGNDANNLTQALKRDTKKQGNWGELILESILEASGLVKDVQYFIQETNIDDEGKIKRPDVVVRFPEGRSVIIDSKVSLTAYTEAYETPDEDFRRKRLKDHAKSVKKHVDELADKKYDEAVKDSIGFILMFIPNDQCYLSALEEEPDLSRYAYSKGIVIISPSNLMMALQLAFNMWQQDIRNKNIENIIKTANELYNKVAGFSESMLSVEKYLNQLSNAFITAKKQLYEGNGNIMKKVETLKSYGLNPRKEIKGLPLDDED